MSDLPKLMLCPLRDDYQFNLGSDVISTLVKNGMPRQRKGSVGTPHDLPPMYCCNKAQFNYLTTFLRVYEGTPILAQLELESSELEWYECRIINKSYPTRANKYGLYYVQLNLVVKPKKHDVQLDKPFVEIYNMTDSEADKFYNSLEQLVNESLPDALGNS